MPNKKEIHVRNTRTVEVVDSILRKQLEDFKMRWAVINAGYPILTDWDQTVQDGWGTFPKVPFERNLIFKGDAQTHAYNHHQAINKLGDKYVASWSGGLLNEDHYGQAVYCAWSCDGTEWSQPQLIAPTSIESKLVRNNAGLYSANDRLYSYIGIAKKPNHGTVRPGITTLMGARVQLDVYETTDVENWKYHENICQDIYLFEGPRPTRGGKLICSGRDLRDNHGIVLAWDDGADPTNPPRVVHLAKSPEGVIPGQGTWYQTEDGRLMLFAREYSRSCRLALTWSDDEGETWSDLLLTDFPNTLSRAFAGRLPDGRYFIVGNNYDVFLDRRHLLIALSDDGYCFNRQYTLVEGNTTRRVNGQHKEDGYQYPSCYIDNHKLLTIYSVNKEDIEIGILDINKID